MVHLGFLGLISVGDTHRYLDDGHEVRDKSQTMFEFVL